MFSTSQGAVALCCAAELAGAAMASRTGRSFMLRCNSGASCSPRPAGYQEILELQCSLSLPSCAYAILQDPLNLCIACTRPPRSSPTTLQTPWTPYWESFCFQLNDLHIWKCNGKWNRTVRIAFAKCHLMLCFTTPSLSNRHSSSDCNHKPRTTCAHTIGSSDYTIQILHMNAQL